MEELRGSRVSGEYKRWKKSTKALLAAYGLEAGMQGLLIYLARKGCAGDTLGMLELDDMCKARGVRQAW